MDKIVGIVSAAPAANVRQDDNAFDRLSSRYTVILLVVFAVIVTASMWVGSPITCWAPVHFHESHTGFATSYCWVRNTYYLPWQSDIPYEHEHEKRQMVPYYQWIPFILLAQAVMFYIPKVVWNGMNQKVGVDADNILDAAQSFMRADKLEGRSRMKLLIVNQFHRCLTSRARKYYKGWHWDASHIFHKFFEPCGTRYGNYLSLLYLFSKFLYIVNVAFQLFMLNEILATEYSIYGVEVLSYLISGRDWTHSPGVAFPRVTFCDLNVRRLGNIHRYTIQCLLPINMYNEKIFMFLWFWFVFVAAMTILDMAVWLARFFSGRDKIAFIYNHLTFMKSSEERETLQHDVTRFVTDYLKADGVFLLRLISHNTSNVTVTDITCALWQKWRDWEKANEQPDDPRKAIEDVNSPSMDGSDDSDKPLIKDQPEAEPLPEKETLEYV